MKAVVTALACVTLTACSSMPKWSWFGGKKEPQVVEAPKGPARPAAYQQWYQPVPRRADVALYPPDPEHTLKWPAPDRQFIVVRVGTYPKPRVAPPAAPAFDRPVPVTEALPSPVPSAPVVSQATSQVPLGPTVTVYFATDSYRLSSDARGALDELVGRIGAAFPQADVRIEGHTDDVGSSTYNEQLSSKRADSVRSYLVSKGASPSRVVAVGVGEASPRQPNTTDAGRAANRRATVRVESKSD